MLDFTASLGFLRPARHGGLPLQSSRKRIFWIIFLRWNVSNLDKKKLVYPLPWDSYSRWIAVVIFGRLIECKHHILNGGCTFMAVSFCVILSRFLFDGLLYYKNVGDVVTSCKNNITWILDFSLRLFRSSCDNIRCGIIILECDILPVACSFNSYYVLGLAVFVVLAKYRMHLSYDCNGFRFECSIVVLVCCLASLTYTQRPDQYRRAVYCIFEYCGWKPENLPCVLCKSKDLRFTKQYTCFSGRFRHNCGP